MRSKLAVPKLIGSPPVPYPGEIPDEEDIARFTHWTSKVRKFVEFYGLLLLPWNAENPYPRDVYQSDIDILPWKGKRSWINWTKIVNHWRDLARQENPARQAIHHNFETGKTNSFNPGIMFFMYLKKKRIGNNKPHTPLSTLCCTPIPPLQQIGSQHEDSQGTSPTFNNTCVTIYK